MMRTRRESIRPQALILLADGASPKYVASALGVDLTTVYRWKRQQEAPKSSDDDALRAARSKAVRKLISLAHKGDLRAIKEVLLRAEELGSDSDSREARRQQALQEAIDYELNRSNPYHALTWRTTWDSIQKRFHRTCAGQLPFPPLPADTPPPDLASPPPTPAECQKADSDAKNAQETLPWG